MSKKSKKYLDSVETWIGLDTTFKGNIISNKAVRIDGKMVGNIEKSEGVVIGESAEIKGNITAKYIVIGGRIEGNIIATEGIELLDKSVVIGNIQTTILSISEGAFFEGKSTMIKQQEDDVEDNKEETEDEEENKQEELIEED
jgi:cytoskeletal protein CcmA (bactofilin family)